MDLNELNKQSYNKIAELFASTRGYIWGDINLLINYVKAGDKVLDVGCGNGRLGKSLKVKGKSIGYIGIDNSEKLIEQARRAYSDIKFEVADILEFGASNWALESFDVVFMNSVLNHFPKDKQTQVLRNVKKVLRPDGKLLMVNWNLWNINNLKSIWRNIPFVKIIFGGERGVVTRWKTTGIDVPLYYYAFTKGEIKRLLKKNGFKIIKNYYSAKNDPDQPGRKSWWLFGLNIVTIARAKD